MSTSGLGRLLEYGHFFPEVLPRKAPPHISPPTYQVRKTSLRTIRHQRLHLKTSPTTIAMNFRPTGRHIRPISIIMLLIREISTQFVDSSVEMGRSSNSTRQQFIAGGGRSFRWQFFQQFLSPAERLFFTKWPYPSGLLPAWPVRPCIPGRGDPQGPDRSVGATTSRLETQSSSTS